MFRSIILRSEAAKDIVRRAVKGTVPKNASIQCLKRRHYHRFLSAQQTQVLKWAPSGENYARRYYSSLPSHIKVTLPALSPTMETGTIVSWNKKEGDKLNEGDLLAEIETDKATMAFETPEEGYLAKIIIPAGVSGIPIGKLVCVIVENEADIAAFKDFKDDGAAKPAAAPAVAAPTPSAPSPAAPATPAPAPAPAGGRVYASPMAKKLAEKHNLRLQGKGTGLFGSITSEDLAKMSPAGAAPSVGAPAPAPAAAISAPPPVPPGASYVDIPVSNIRETIARRLLEAKTTVPHYYLTVECRVDKLMEVRNKFNKKYEKSGVKLSVNDFLIKAIASACKRVPDVNSYWLGKTIRKFKNVDVSVAVQTPTGLITPIVFEADSKGLLKISSEVKALANKAKEGKLQPQEFQGGTICISNLGMFGIDVFSAIINPPQSIIVAVGTASKKLFPADNERGFEEGTVIHLTASCDHRTVDGALGAQFLKALQENVEDPSAMCL